MISMKAISTHTLATALVLAVAVTLAGQARAGGELVKFPDSYTGGMFGIRIPVEHNMTVYPEHTPTAGVLYATVDRSNIKEEISTSRAAIDAVKNGQPIPNGAVITLVD